MLLKGQTWTHSIWQPKCTYPVGFHVNYSSQNGWNKVPEDEDEHGWVLLCEIQCFFHAPVSRCCYIYWINAKAWLKYYAAFPKLHNSLRCIRLHTNVSVTGKPNFKDLNSALVSILFLEVEYPDIRMLHMTWSKVTILATYV